MSLRAELFGVTQLENHAQLLAEGHSVEVRRRQEHLLHRLADSERGINSS